MKEYTFTLTENALKNLISTYAHHKIICEEYQVEYEDDYSILFDSTAYAHRSACCQTAEEWMNVLGISPESNFVAEIIEKEREERC